MEQQDEFPPIERHHVLGLLQSNVMALVVGDRQCPVWLPCDPEVPHIQRQQCVKFGRHTEHSATYLIEEQSLD